MLGLNNQNDKMINQRLFGESCESGCTDAAADRKHQQVRSRYALKRLEDTLNIDQNGLNVDHNI